MARELAQKPQPPGAKFTQGLLDVEGILRALDLQAGQWVLDAGCGNGYMCMHFSAAVGPSGSVVAMDRDESFVGALKAVPPGTNIEVVRGDITRPTDLPPASMDCIYLSTVLHIFSPTQRQGFIGEARRLLKPEATLAIIEIEKREMPFGPPLHCRYAPEDLKALFPITPVKTVAVGKYFYMQLFKNV